MNRINNKITFLLLLIIFNSLVVLSQDTSKTKIKGYTVFKYENGQVSSEGVMVDGKPNGYWKTYYETSIIKSEGSRKNFELDSLWKFYNEDGKLILSITYGKGRKNGIKTTYQQKETVKENYVNDIKDGLTCYYYPDGKLRLAINFIKGREQGYAKEYSREGAVITLLEYKNGYLIGKEKVNRFGTDSLKQGKWVTFYPNGVIHTEEYYNAGIKNGYFKEYSPDGNLLGVVKYVNGQLMKDAAEVKKLDIKKDYYSSGSVKRMGSYYNNVREGITREYSPEGKITAAEVYEHGIDTSDVIIDEQGLRQGLCKNYYETGELKAQGKYVNGLKIGEWKYFYKNGKVEQVGTYLKNEKPDGEWIWYHDNGKVLRDENFSVGVENGPMTEYSDSGTVIAKGEYVDGQEEGPWLYQWGDIKMEGSYKEGKRDGDWKYYYDDGTTNFVGSYLDDNENGKHTFYWDNGKVKEVGNYIMGKREGEWLRYNYDGTLFLTTTYKNGVEIKYDGVKIKPPTDLNSGD